MIHPASAPVAQATLPSPLGPLLAVVSAQGLAGLWFEGQAHHPGTFSLPEAPDHPMISETRRVLAHYWETGTVQLNGVALAPAGTAFQCEVWRQLLTIADGDTRSYGQIASALGKPQASRAVGAAVGRNPISVLIPCHRVLGSAGALTGYAGGLDRKQRLLALESRRTGLFVAEASHARKAAACA